MKKSRRLLGVLGELASHTLMIIEGKNRDIMESLAMRYLLIEVGTILRTYCMSEYGSISACVKGLSTTVGGDIADYIREIIKVRDDLISSRGDIQDEVVRNLLSKVSEIYVKLERSVPDIP